MPLPIQQFEDQVDRMNSNSKERELRDSIRIALASMGWQLTRYLSAPILMELEDVILKLIKSNTTLKGGEFDNGKQKES